MLARGAKQQHQAHAGRAEQTRAFEKSTARESLRPAAAPVHGLALLASPARGALATLSLPLPFPLRRSLAYSLPFHADAMPGRAFAACLKPMALPALSC